MGLFSAGRSQSKEVRAYYEKNLWLFNLNFKHTITPPGNADTHGILSPRSCDSKCFAAIDSLDQWPDPFPAVLPSPSFRGPLLKCEPPWAYHTQRGLSFSTQVSQKGASNYREIDVESCVNSYAIPNC